MRPTDYEQSMQRSMVEAVEQRYAHDQEVKRRSKRQRLINNILSSLVLLVAGGAAAWYLYNSSFKLPDNAPKVNYADTLPAFGAGKVTYWKDAPEKIRPQRAAPGATYTALAANRSGTYDMYLMVKQEKGIDFWKVLPYRGTVKATQAEFDESVKGGGYLVLYQGKVYAAGRMSLAAAEGLRSSLPQM